MNRAAAEPTPRAICAASAITQAGSKEASGRSRSIVALPVNPVTGSSSLAADS